MSRVFVSGGSGYVGRRLIETLVANGHQVGALVRRPAAFSAPCEIFAYDGTAQSVGAALSGGFDAIVHLAASLEKSASLESVDTLVDTNVKLLAQLAQAGSLNGVGKFVNISTYSISIDGLNYTPQTLYASTKKAAEDILAYYHQSTPMKACSLRLYDVYGPNQPHSRFLNAVMRAVISGQELVMSRGEQEICFVEVDDVVDAISHCLMTDSAYIDPHENVFSVYGDEVITLSEVPRLVAEAIGRASPPIVASLPYRPNEVMKFHPQCQRLPGWVPSTRFAQGVARMFALGGEAA